jgi:hypothetical protein
MIKRPVSVASANLRHLAANLLTAMFGLWQVHSQEEKFMHKAGLLILTTFMIFVPVLKTQSAVPDNREDGKTVPSPSNFPKAGLELWLSAGQVEQANGEITLIRDISANANHARRNPDSTAPSTDPLLVTDAASGQPVLRFSGANVAFNFKPVSDIRTAFWVVSKDPAAFGHLDERFVLGDTVSHDFHSGWTDDTIFNVVYDNPNPSGHLSKYLHDGKTFLNGQEMDASKTPFPKKLSVISMQSTGPVEANQLARDRQFAGRSWQGDIAEVLLYDAALSWADRQTVEKYLIAKYHIDTGSIAPAVLPGNGPAQHPFLYAGEWDTRKPQEQSIFIVRGGKVVWQYTMPLKNAATGNNQEFDDATQLSNGNIIFSHMSGAAMVSPDKKILWHYDAPPGTEVHSIQSIGKDRVLIMRNGHPAQAMIINTATGKTEKEVPIPTTVHGTHGQFRHIRMTEAGTLLVPHLVEGKVVEYDLDGKVLRTIPDKSPWQAVPLKSGNILISGDFNRYVREVNTKDETVWQFTQADAPEYRLGNFQTADRLANGNTIITCWVAGDDDASHWPGTVQVLEVTPEKHIVWAMSSWKNPDLGPATSIQLLDQPGNPDNLDSQQR